MRIQVVFLALSIAHAANLVAAHTAADTVSPVAKVVELLQAMETKLKAEGEAESALYEEFVLWSVNEQSDTRATITQSKQTVSDAEAFLEDQAAFRDNLNAEVNDVIGEIARIDNELTAATEVRAHERKEFEITDKDRADALRQVAMAIDVMAKSGSAFLQQSMVKKLQETALVQGGNTEVSLLLSKAEGKDQIVELMHNIEDSTSTARADALEVEQQAQNSFDTIEQSLKTELQAANEMKADKQREVSTSEENSARKTSEMNTAKKVLVETQAHLSDLTVEFSQKTAEQKESLALRSDELTAIQEAVAILTSARAMSVFNLETPEGDAPPAELTVKATKLSKVVLPESATPVVSLVQVKALTHGPFDKVKNMVQDMLTKLQKEGAEAADHHAFCQEEMGKTVKSLKTKQKEVTKLGTRLEARQASITEMNQRHLEITEELSDMGKAMANATSLRSDEAAQSGRAIAEYGDAVTILTSAMNVLQEVFAEKATGGNAIIGILEVAQSDFRKLLLESQTQESAAAADFKKQKSGAKVREAALNTELEGVTRMNLETASDEQHLSRELDSVRDEVLAVQDYYTQLKPQCEVKTPSHEERQERRANQIDGLQNALGVLSGDAIA